MGRNVRNGRTTALPLCIRPLMLLARLEKRNAIEIVICGGRRGANVCKGGIAAFFPLRSAANVSSKGRNSETKKGIGIGGGRMDTRVHKESRTALPATHSAANVPSKVRKSELESELDFLVAECARMFAKAEEPLPRRCIRPLISLVFLSKATKETSIENWTRRM